MMINKPSRRTSFLIDKKFNHFRNEKHQRVFTSTSPIQKNISTLRTQYIGNQKKKKILI